MSDAPTVSIIIPAKNEARNIRECLAAIFAQECDAAFDVIVVDSGSTDGTPEIINEFPVRLHQIRPEEFGHGRTRNLGASLSTGRVVVFLNADATPQGRHWLPALLKELTPADVAAVYGRQVARPDAYPMERFFLDYWYGPQRRVQTMRDGHLDVDTVFYSTVNGAMKREFWEHYPFSEDVVMTEDQVWSREIIAAGHTIVYAPDAAVVHSHNYRLKQAFRRFFDSGWSAEASYMAGGGSALALVRRTAGYPIREMLWLARHGHWRWMPFAAVYESAKMAGVFAGRSHRLLPERLKQAISANYRPATTRGTPPTHTRGGPHL